MKLGIFPLKLGHYDFSETSETFDLNLGIEFYNKI